MALKAKLGTISQEAQSKLEEDTAKKEAKAEAKADAARKKKLVRSQNLIEFQLANYSKGLSSGFRLLVVPYLLSSPILGRHQTDRTQQA